MRSVTRWVWSKLPNWGRLLMVLAILAVGGYIVFLIISNLVYIVLGLLFLVVLVAMAKETRGTSRYTYHGEDDVHIYHHHDHEGRPRTKGFGFKAANSHLYAPTVNKKGVDFIAGRPGRRRK